jgi:hypothetical protein
MTVSMATLNYHLAFSDKTIKFQDWEKFFSECSDPSSNAGVGVSYDEMFERTAQQKPHMK